MLYELRTYSVMPGKVGEVLRLVEQEALPVLQEHSRLIGWWFTDVGPLNQIVHLWEYKDASDREKARAARLADPRLLGCRDRILSLIVSQSNMLLSPASFSPLK